MLQLSRWDEFDVWEKRPVSATSMLLTLAILVATVWGVLALTSTPSPSDVRTSMINVEQSHPVPYVASNGPTGSVTVSVL